MATPGKDVNHKESASFTINENFIIHNNLTYLRVSLVLYKCLY